MKRKKQKPLEYTQYVEHPRYGKWPRETGLNPSDAEGSFSWRSGRIADTAIVADTSRQQAATFPWTHYFDEKRVCEDCERPFIFFAEEQRHWYEELGFGLDSDCVRCVPCRKKEQGLARKRERYESLYHVSAPTNDERLEMIDSILSLIEAGLFDRRQTERVRMHLNKLGDAAGEQRAEILERVAALELP